MRAKLKFLLLYFLGWMIFFQLMRLVFLIYHLDKSQVSGFKTTMLSALVGARMDMSMAAYLVAPVTIFVLLSVLIPFFRRPAVYNIYTCLLLGIMLLVTFIDLGIYQAWGFRVDPTPLKYLSTPKEAWASVSHLPLLMIALGYLLVTALAGWLAVRMIRRMSLYLQATHRWYIQVIIILAFGVLLIIPIRGGFQLAPINQSSVYFSKDNFANQAALNAPWNLMHGFLNKSSQKENPYNYFEQKTASQIIDSLYRPLNTGNVELLKTKHPNVLLIIWESFTSKAVDTTIEGIEVTPYFNRLKREGVFFANMYASGDRTDKGLSAILSGYPALPKTSVLRSPNKAAKLSSIGEMLKAKGYATSFYYGGETEFANIKSYIFQSGYDAVADQSDFPRKYRNSKWGAHDGFVKEKIVKDLASARQPFFTTWLTLTSHEPFEVPVKNAFSGRDNASKFLGSLHYTDSVVYEFVQQCKTQPWWENTVVIIIGDHGHPLPETGKRADNFHIPMLWLGGALNKSFVFEPVVSQLDLAQTLAHQLGHNTNEFPFSKNIFFNSSWAFFCFNNGFGFVTEEQQLLYDNVGGSIMEMKGNAEGLMAPGKAMQQFTYGDFMNR